MHRGTHMLISFNAAIISKLWRRLSSQVHVSHRSREGAFEEVARKISRKVQNSKIVSRFSDEDASDTVASALHIAMHWRTPAFAKELHRWNRQKSMHRSSLPQIVDWRGPWHRLTVSTQTLAKCFTWSWYINECVFNSSMFPKEFSVRDMTKGEMGLETLEIEPGLHSHCTVELIEHLHGNGHCTYM